MHGGGIAATPRSAINLYDGGSSGLNLLNILDGGDSASNENLIIDGNGE